MMYGVQKTNNQRLITNNYLWLWLIPLLLLITWLGARGLNADGLWVDEVWSVYTAGGSHYGPFTFGQVWERIAIEDAWQAPGYYLLLNGWGALVGWTEFAMRVISLLFGALSLAMTYRVGRELSSPLVGLAAAVTLGVSGFYINFLHELRGYTLYVFLTCTCVWSYWRLVKPQIYFTPANQRTNERSVLPLHRMERGLGGEVSSNLFPQIIFVLSVAGLLYIHYFASITIAVLGLYHLLFAHRTMGLNPFSKDTWRWWRVGVLTGIGILLFVPWLRVLLSALDLAQSYPRTAIEPLAMVMQIINLFSGYNLMLVLIVGGAALLPQETRQTHRFVPTMTTGEGLAWFWLIAWFIVAVIICVVLKMGEARYFMGLFPALAIIVGLGVRRLAQNSIHPALPLGVWTLLSVWTINTLGPVSGYHWDGWHEPLRELSEVLDGQTREDDTIFYQLQENVNAWLHDDVALYYFPDIPGRMFLYEAMSDVPYTEYTARAVREVNGVQRLWLAVDPLARPWRMAMLNDAFVGAGFSHCGNFASTARISVDLFAAVAPDNFSPLMSFSHPSYNDGISVRLLGDVPPSADDTLPVILGWWQGQTIPRETYSVALHVLDANGNLVAQGQDYGLPYEALSCRVTNIDVNALQPGDYTLTLTVYAWQTGERLSGILNTTYEQGERLTLATFSR